MAFQISPQIAKQDFSFQTLFQAFLCTLTVLLRLIRRHRNVRSGRTTMVAKKSWPTSDRSSRIVNFCPVHHSAGLIVSFDILYTGRLIDMVEVLIRMPRYVSDTFGPSSFPRAIGMFSQLNNAIVSFSACVELF